MNLMADDFAYHDDDLSECCFHCGNSGRLFVVRQIESMKMVHVCSRCLLDHEDGYLLDNTRPWARERS